MIELIDSPSPITIPITPHAVPSRFLSASKETELVSTVQVEPATMLNEIIKATITIKSRALTSAADPLFPRKQSPIKPALKKTAANRMIFRLNLGFTFSICPKIRANTAPSVYGMTSMQPIVTQSMQKRLRMSSFRFSQMHSATWQVKVVPMIIQKSLGNYNKQLALNYSYYSYSYPCYDLSRDSSLFRLSFLPTKIDTPIAASTASKSKMLAMYQGRLIECVLSYMQGTMATLIALKIKGRLIPNPIIISKFYDAQRAMMKPCIVKAEEPAMPTTALKTQTMQIQPSGRKSNRTAISSSEKKELKAMTSTVFWRGNLSRMMPKGISVIMTGKQVQKQSRLIYSESRLQGSSRSGAWRA